MTMLRRCGMVAVAALAIAGGSTSSAKAWGYWGGYRGGFGYGYGGFAPGFGAGLAVGGLYGGYYPRPYYAAPPVIYLPPPIYLAPPPPPPFYAEPLPVPRRVVHHVRVVRPAPQCRCIQPSVPRPTPAPLHDVPSPEAP